MSFFTSEYIICGQKNYDALHYLLGNIFIRFGLKLLRKTVGISLGTVIVFLLLQIRFLVCFVGFWFVMRETSCVPFLAIRC